MVKARITLLVAIAAALSACAYDASYGDCAVRCTTDSGCPDGLTCGEEGVCRDPQAEACVLPSDGTGGTISHVGGRTIHTFVASQSGETFTPPAIASVEVLVVGGGGGGGSTRGGGGGGAGGLVHIESYTIDQPAYTVTVGYGGAPATSGGNSTFGTLNAIGGGAGAGDSSGTLNGGSGGGAHHGVGPSGTGMPGQGSDGGVSGVDSGTTIFTAAGGGGAGGGGAVGASSGGGTGGPGLASDISGVPVYYAGGGGGGAQNLGTGSLLPGPGGNGGGGDGGMNTVGRDGVAGTGGGGGGGGAFLAGGHGGSGVVIISYPTYPP